MSAEKAILPPISREAHARLVREAVLAEREACAQLASRRVCSILPCVDDNCRVCAESTAIAAAIRRRK
jgi:hypothetical protein